KITGRNGPIFSTVALGLSATGADAIFGASTGSGAWPAFASDAALVGAALVACSLALSSMSGSPLVINQPVTMISLTRALISDRQAALLGQLLQRNLRPRADVLDHLGGGE